MALLQDLIQQIDDSALKERILHETNKLLKQKKFGLVFEEHLPECTPLYDVPIRVGSKVALKTGYVSDIYTVMNIDDNEVQCDRRETHEQKTFRLDELVTVAEFGEAIYPTLKPIDTVENATREQVEEAAKIANAHEFIMSLPQGYETDIGQRGIKLSAPCRSPPGLSD